MDLDAGNPPRIGPLEYAPELAEFLGDVSVGTETIEVTLALKGQPVSESVVQYGRSVLERLDQLAETATTWVVTSMLELANGWIPVGEPRLSEDELRRCIRLIQFRTEPTGKCHFTFADGDTFWGHHIVVEMDADGTFHEPDLWG